MENFLSRPRNSVRERKLAQELRKLPEESRFRYIQNLLNNDYVVGLKLANACLRKKSYFEAILGQGLEMARVSDIQLWLKCVIPRLGFRRVVSLVSKRLETNTEAVNKALYYLCILLPRDDKRAVQALIKLSKLMESKGLLLKPAYVPRRTLLGRVKIKRIE